MVDVEMTHEKFLSILKEIAQKDTSSDPDNWTPINPLWGHCTVATRLAEDYFGGEVVRASLQDVPKYAYVRWHYWNKLPNGKEIDFTGEQYPDIAITDLKGELREREADFKHEDVLKRYNLLKQRFGKLV